MKGIDKRQCLKLTCSVYVIWFLSTFMIVYNKDKRIYKEITKEYLLQKQ